MQTVPAAMDDAHSAEQSEAARDARTGVPPSRVLASIAAPARAHAAPPPICEDTSSSVQVGEKRRHPPRKRGQRGVHKRWKAVADLTWADRQALEEAQARKLHEEEKMMHSKRGPLHIPRDASGRVRPGVRIADYCPPAPRMTTSEYIAARAAAAAAADADPESSDTGSPMQQLPTAVRRYRSESWGVDVQPWLTRAASAHPASVGSSRNVNIGVGAESEAGVAVSTFSATPVTAGGGSPGADPCPQRLEGDVSPPCLDSSVAAGSGINGASSHSETSPCAGDAPARASHSITDSG